MRTRPLLALVTVVLVIICGGVYALTRPLPSSGSERRPASAEEVAGAYLTAWEGGDLAAMERLAGGAPADFIERHRAFAEELGVESLTVTPGAIRLRGDRAAELPFEGVREIEELGEWPFSSTLKLAREDGEWKVAWAPETLHPALAGGGRLRTREIPAPRARLVTSSGARFPRDSGAEDYLAELREGLLGEAAGEGEEDGEAAGEDGEDAGLVLEAVEPGGGVRRLLGSGPPPAEDVRTTFSRRVQAAAARALDGVGRPAAIVAVGSGTGEVLAVADRLGGRKAFLGLYPPGSTFKVVTAAALLSAGLTPDSPVSCPDSYSPPGGYPFRNASSVTALGETTLTRAFAVSCNTAFAERAVTGLQDGGLVRAAELFGFNRPLPGVPGRCGSIRAHTTGDELAADSFGQNSVEASPLCMALAAAAVESGHWHSPTMTRRRGEEEDRPLPPGVAEGLRTMMRAVVTEGSASGVPLPEGTAGKTGTAEAATGEHAWFVGYRDGVAFAVFVENGGSGAGTALPVAARFLRAL
ncbi:penicillin-binding transpeptidase domain-containing protein [Planomonospora parontospora]|uniref:penicillin-binding transpeptidase domain-containing protein n=1 Tax=Planomonospora parontospora TaxID=58119 RepID=UPI001670624A|nr:penicillin-binding transpeptidase domain-containing protein [Planomonospora parontospora]GGL30893.1 penicillin-binding protein [Planomonospora parontospora subsp. antibiotica]GII16648.1 penicillin-binding protein [Planomonospora parontospora subsp. antibiotica]